jgi:hypothetical protein
VTPSGRGTLLDDGERSENARRLAEDKVRAKRKAADTGSGERDEQRRDEQRRRRDVEDFFAQSTARGVGVHRGRAAGEAATRSSLGAPPGDGGTSSPAARRGEGNGRKENGNGNCNGVRRTMNEVSAVKAPVAQRGPAAREGTKRSTAKPSRTKGRS